MLTLSQPCQTTPAVAPMAAPSISFRGRPDRQLAAILDEGPPRAEKAGQHAEGEPITAAQRARGRPSR
jgi:hypothetical protein